jgi:hypothetical protein
MLGFWRLSRTPSHNPSSRVVNLFTWQLGALKDTNTGGTNTYGTDLAQCHFFCISSGRAGPNSWEGGIQRQEYQEVCLLEPPIKQTLIVYSVPLTGSQYSTCKILSSSPENVILVHQQSQGQGPGTCHLN